MKEKLKKYMGAVRLILFGVLVICAVGIGIFVYRWNKQRHASDEVAKIAASSLEADAEDEEEDIPEDPLMDFEALREINEDIVAYIKIPGTNVDYPVLQDENDTDGNWYYLNHNLDGSSGRPGCIFIEAGNAADFSDPVSILYGHNMKDGSMFATIHSYESDVFMAEYPYIYIYTPEKNYIYRVFASYNYDDRHIMRYFHDFSDTDILDGYINDIFQTYALNGVVDDTVEVSSEDKLLILETCTGVGADYRYLVHAVQLSEDEKLDVLRANMDAEGEEE